MADQVSNYAGFKQHQHIGTIGYGVAAGLFVMMLPFLPFLAVLYVFQKLSADGTADPRAEHH